ncbi:MAG TPA: hypothetical protein VI138_04925 [Candidatus Dormibacteraeota bacterium]
MSETRPPAEPNSVDLVNGSRRKRLLMVTGLVVAGAILGALIVQPLYQQAPATISDLDLSWQLSLGEALTQHLQFGPEYIFTYGPLGFLHVAMAYPSAALSDVAAVVDVAFYVAYAISMLLFADLVRRSLSAGPIASIAILVGTAVVAYLTGSSADVGTIAELLSLVAISSWLLRVGRPRNDLLALGAGGLLAFGALYKVDLLLVALAELIILSGAVWWLPARPIRLAAVSWASFLVVYPVLWVATGQSLLNLPSFWTGSWAVTNGYSAAMSLAMDWVPLARYALLAVCGILIPVVIRNWRRRSLSVQQAVILLCLPWLLASWKDGLVRIGGLNNGRALDLLGAILGVAWLVALLSPKMRWRWALGPVLAAGLCTAVVISVFGPFVYRPWVVDLLWSPPPGPAAPASPGDAIPANVIASLRGHTVNVFPWAVSIAVDNHLDWDPVPEPQTYGAYTEYLDQLDAGQLASGRGASRLVVSLLDIDGRYLFWDPPAVWDTVISRYSCRATTGMSAILARRPARVGAERVLRTSTGSMGQWFAVPRTNLPYEFADLGIGSSLEGTVLGAVLRQTAVFATVRLSDGEVVGPERLVAATAGDGLYLSHFLRTPKQLCGALSGGDGGVPHVIAVRLTTAHPTQWASSVSIRFLGAPALRRR